MFNKSTSQKRQIAGCRKKVAMIGTKSSYQPSAESNYPPGAGRKTRHVAAGQGMPWKFGIPIILAMVFGVCASVWLGWKIDHGLAELSLQRQKYAVETENNQILVAERDRLMAKINITRKAAVLGLFPPNANQIRKP